MHLTHEQMFTLAVCTFTLIVVGIDVLLSCAIYRELRRQGRDRQPPLLAPADPYAERMRRLTTRLDETVGRPWSMSVRPRRREGDDGNGQ